MLVTSIYPLFTIFSILGGPTWLSGKVFDSLSMGPVFEPQLSTGKR